MSSVGCGAFTVVPGITRVVMRHRLLAVASLYSLLALSPAAAQSTTPAFSAGPLLIEALSTDPSRVTGGDVLVRVTVPSGTQPSALRVSAGGRTLRSSFSAESSTSMVGLVSDLPPGSSSIEIAAGTVTGRMNATRG